MFTRCRFTHTATDRKAPEFDTLVAGIHLLHIDTLVFIPSLTACFCPRWCLLRSVHPQPHQTLVSSSQTSWSVPTPEQTEVESWKNNKTKWKKTKQNITSVYTVQVMLLSHAHSFLTYLQFASNICLFYHLSVSQLTSWQFNCFLCLTTEDKNTNSSTHSVILCFLWNFLIHCFVH